MAAALLLAWPAPTPAHPSADYITEVVTIPSGGLKLRGLIGRPKGDGPFPAYIQNHGSMTIEEAGRNPWTVITKESLSDTLVRLSTGCEHPRDLVADLLEGLAAVEQARAVIVPAYAPAGSAGGGAKETVGV